MPEKKKQHYVPQLLLRQFSTDLNRKLINIFHVDTKFHKTDCPLKYQSQESYFYGEDSEIEDSLGKIENAAAPVIKNIIKNLSLPKKGTIEYQNLFIFSFLLAYRTKSASDELNEFINQTLQEVKKHDSTLSKEEYNDLQFKFNNSAVYSIATVSKVIFGAFDLELKLLHNKTKSKFIISDNPSIRYNQFLEQRKHPGGHTGLFTKGLQIFIPISPDCILVYFDKWAYKFGNKKDKVIAITNDSDVEQLNLLQAVNCSKVLYSCMDTSEHVLCRLGDKAFCYRHISKNKIMEVNNRYIDKDGNEHIYLWQHGVEKKIKMHLSFVKQPQQAKSYVMSDDLVQVRDESIRN